MTKKNPNYYYWRYENFLNSFLTLAVGDFGFLAAAHYQPRTVDYVLGFMGMILTLCVFENKWANRFLNVVLWIVELYSTQPGSFQFLVHLLQTQSVWQPAAPPAGSPVDTHTHTYMNFNRSWILYTKNKYYELQIFPQKNNDSLLVFQNTLCC